ncbi:uncharacterized protein BP01DRAFT_379055 [Aspergillus saccharolyticus JOP 1030-1]|uniref:Uncharacterized protein n=1 Tax=Aspergillus saccharolyticus JOP 1030-1 TaxID=1450539 RepID=A0A318ZS93_9EURO|nr:hypothetical protein BP01DRAFT_379055 [Aspergillus saccharolyticus JOP 1030-1]PYH49484.1 hypothetical protein BP01DRAFT_379055 [Aspergillus saccharolyticus JOP 1030-1]
MASTQFLPSHDLLHQTEWIYHMTPTGEEHVTIPVEFLNINIIGSATEDRHAQREYFLAAREKLRRRLLARGITSGQESPASLLLRISRAITHASAVAGSFLWKFVPLREEDGFADGGKDEGWEECSSCHDFVGVSQRGGDGDSESDSDNEHSITKANTLLDSYDTLEDFTVRLEFSLNLSAADHSANTPTPANAATPASNPHLLPNSEPTAILNSVIAYIDEIVATINTTEQCVPLPFSTAPALASAHITKHARAMMDPEDADEDEDKECAENGTSTCYSEEVESDRSTSFKGLTSSIYSGMGECYGRNSRGRCADGVGVYSDCDDDYQNPLIYNDDKVVPLGYENETHEKLISRFCQGPGLWDRGCY